MKYARQNDLKYDHFINCVYSENITRKMIFQFPKNEAINDLIKLKLNNNFEKFTINNISIKNMDLSFKHYNTPTKQITFVFNGKFNLKNNSKYAYENLLKINVNRRTREMPDIELYIHSPQNILMNDNKLNKFKNEFIDIFKANQFVYIDKNF